jgi:uncharacterized protein (DUF983 family)
MTQADKSDAQMQPFNANRTRWLLRCPQCGQGHLLRGLLSPNDACEVCGHDFTGYGAADGPAYIAVVIVGTLVTMLASWAELVYEPPYWLHIVLWLPMIMVLSLICLRVSKGWIAASHYRHQHREPMDIAQGRSKYQGHSHD